MSSKFGNFVKEKTATTGTGDVTLTSISGFARFSDAFVVGQVVVYAILDGSNRETGVGVVRAGNTLERTTPETTLVAGVFDDSSPAAITIASGEADVYATMSAGTLLAENVLASFLGVSTFNSVQHIQDVFHSSGVTGDHSITDDADGTITIPAGSGLIRATDSDTATLFFIDWASESGTNVDLVDNDLNYIYVEYNAGSPQVIATTTKRADANTNIHLGHVYRVGTTLHITAEAAFHVSDHAGLMILRNQETAPFARVSGGIISETGTRNLAVTAGAWWHGLERYTTSAKDTNVSDTFTCYYQDGVGGFTALTAQTQINNTQYDDGSGTLATLTTNRYGVHWVYLGVDGDFYVVFGRGDYTLANAEAAPIPTNLPPHFEAHARILGKIIIQKSAASFTTIETAFETTFEGGLPTDHGDLTGLTDDDHTQYLLADGTRAATKFEFINEIYKANATLNGTAIDNHINIGAGTSVTGTAAQAYDYCTVLGGLDNSATLTKATVLGGSSNLASADHATVVGGFSATASGQYSVCLGGFDNGALSLLSIVLGGQTNKAQTGSYTSVVGGRSNKAEGTYSGVLGGRGNNTAHTHSLAFCGGSKTRANFDIVQGATDTATASTANNTIRLQGTGGNIKIDGAVTSPEADYAEFFEWADGNNADQDRVGKAVSLVAGKIEIGNSNIIGIISGTPAVIGNGAPNHWHKMYLRDKHKRQLKVKYIKIDWVDVWGDEHYVYESQDKTLYDEYPQPTAVNGILSDKTPIGNLKKTTIFTPMINPAFDINEVYIPREDRKEWGVVGLLGQLIVNTAEVITGTHIDFDSNGDVINGTTYQVIEVIDDQTITVFYK